MPDLNQYRGFDEFQGVPDEEENTAESQREDYDPARTEPVGVKRDAEGKPEPVYEESSGPKNAQETLGKAPKPEQSQEEADKEHQMNLFQQATEWVATEVLQQDPEDRAKKKEEYQAWARKGAEQIENAEGFGAFTRDSVRAVTSGVEKAGQDAIGFANFAGDFAKTRMGLVDPDDEWNNTDHANYRGSERDLIMAEPRSQAGQFARDMVTFVVMQRQLGAVTGLNKVAAGKGLINPQRLAADTTPGAIADFIIDPCDGNASNALIETFPSLENNPMIAAFAQADDDDEFTRRLKNTIEGGVMGVAVDAAGTGLKGLFKGAKAIVDWIRKHPGKKAADAPAEVKEAAYRAFYDQLELDMPSDVASTKPPKDLQAIDVFDEMASSGDFSRANQLNARELRSLVQDFEVVSFANRKDLLKEVDPEVSMEALGEAIYTKKLPNGAEIDWIATKVDTAEEWVNQGELDLSGMDLSPEAQARLQSNRASFNRTADEMQGQEVIRIDWDLGGEDVPTQVDFSDPKVRDLAQDDWNKADPIEKWDDLTPERQDEHIEFMRKDGEFGFQGQKEIGNHGTKLYRQFGEVAKKQKPGTIIQAEAADDGFGVKGTSEAQHRRSEAQARRAERGIEVDENNIRERLYQRSGLSAPNDEGIMYGIVKYRPNGRKVLQPLDVTKPIQEQVDEAIESARQYELDIDFDSAEVRPGKFERYVEDYENGGNRFRQDYEPYERAGKTAEFPMEKVIREQAEDATRPPFAQGGPSPRLTDNTVRQINEAGGEAALAQKAVDELGESFAPQLRSKDPEVVALAEKQYLKLINDNLPDGEVKIDALTELVEEDGLPTPYLRTLLGQVVTKTWIKDLSVQMRDFGAEAKQIASTGADANRQYNLLMDRLKAAVTLQIREGSLRGKKLAAMQGNLSGNTKEVLDAKVEKFTDKIDDLQKRLNEGDPEAVEQANVLAESFVLADGDPNLALSFGAKFAKMVKEDYMVTLYNSYLSGINTQGRNILGNLFNVALKPASIAIGAVEPGQRKAAMAMYGSFLADFGEGFQIAKTAFMDPTTPRRLEGTWQGMNMDKKLKNLRQSIDNPMQWPLYVVKAAQYYGMANPWLQGATRMLSATDDGFKVLSARQKARYDAMMLLGEGEQFNPTKFETVWSTKFKNGEIVDEDLLNWAKQDTFQEDLGETMQAFSKMTNDNIVFKYVVPFVKTPTNIMKQFGHFIPFGGVTVRSAHRFADAANIDIKFFNEYMDVMKGSDNAMKAVYRGREAIGTTTFMGGVILGQHGFSTGSGPSDPDKNKAWREAGNQPHSIKLGGVWVSNRFLGPLGLVLSMSADIGYLSTHAGAYDNYMEMFGQGVYSIGGALLDQSWMKGLMDTFTTMYNVTMQRRDIDPRDAVAAITRTMIPYQAALRSLNNFLQPGVYDFNNSMDKLRAEVIPGYKTENGSERISIRTGKPVYLQGYSATNQVLPFGLKDAQEDPTIGRLVDLGIDFPMEMYDKYKGYELSAADTNKINEYYAKSGVWKKLEGYINSEAFEAEIQEWRDTQGGRDRKTANWYKRIRDDLGDARTQAINDYRTSGTPEGIAFDDRIYQIDQAIHLDTIGAYGEASKTRELIKLSNP